ncbi:amidohydrolase family protein [Labrys monachus]|uniref:TIM-barrel fold metal-dependent hydrolase n=1 Tax=Labrys monachus TaxID=217067 RepID=A0ABU0FH26_9HYPH|nr:amidohydrolase [Labrys monachus]MDQ0393913.1 putative TIM-barrel fold metal-dependent hydrolase [Labrys monachus]
MPLIDTHLHIVDLEALRYPWLDGAEALRRTFSYQSYEREALRCGITDALHMEVDVDPAMIEAENAYVEGLSRARQTLLRGAISACRPESVDFPAFLERQCANPFIKGFRRVLHTERDDLSEGALFRANIARLAGTGRPFDLCVLPHQIEKAIAVADSAPDVSFVLDHCGVPAIKDRAEHPWREAVSALAKRPHVAAKISGVVAYADGANWTVADLRPFVEHVIASFGWDRVVWGSDWPVCTLNASLSTWVAATHALLAGCSEGEREGLFHRNARRIWRL